MAHSSGSRHRQRGSHCGRRAGRHVPLAFEFLVLTAARSGEVRLATWDEIDLLAVVWAVPAERMKANREHRVPLCERTAEILTEARSLRDGSRLVFPSPRGKPLSDMTLSKLVREQGIAAVPHGFRSSFRDWAGEPTNHPRDVIEAALAHTVQNKVEAAYARSDLFERRRRLMDDWASALGKPYDTLDKQLTTSRSITSHQPVPRSHPDVSGLRTPSMDGPGSWTTGTAIADQRQIPRICSTRGVFWAAVPVPPRASG